MEDELITKIAKIRVRISEFDGLVTRKNKAEIWFEDPKVTDEQRELYFPELLNICNRLKAISKELKKLGYEVQPEAFWLGIK